MFFLIKKAITVEIVKEFFLRSNLDIKMFNLASGCFLLLYDTQILLSYRHQVDKLKMLLMKRRKY